MVEHGSHLTASNKELSISVTRPNVDKYKIMKKSEESCTAWHTALKMAFADELKAGGYKVEEYIPNFTKGTNTTPNVYRDDGGTKTFIQWRRDGDENIKTYQDDKGNDFFDWEGRTNNDISSENGHAVGELTHIELLSNTLPYIKNMAEDSENKLLQSCVLGLDKFILLYNSSNNKESLIEDLNMSYTRLYCLGNGVSISESVYLSPEHLVNQDMEAESLYKRDGFQMNHSSNEPLDHFSYELKYISYLSKQLYISYKTNLLDKQSELINKQQDFYVIIFFNG